MQVIVCSSADARHCDAGDDWQHGWLVATDKDHDRQPDSGTQPLAVFDALPKGMRIIASRGRPLIVFHPDGSAAGSNAELTLCHRGDQRGGRAVVIANSGRVRIRLRATRSSAGMPGRREINHRFKHAARLSARHDCSRSQRSAMGGFAGSTAHGGTFLGSLI